MGQILEMLEGDSYTMRNAVLTLVGHVLLGALLADRSESGVKTRDQLLDILEERINDVSAYTRKCALQARTMHPGISLLGQ
jgi:condensin complex subunit 1